MAYVAPIILVIISNIVYQLSAKSTPAQVNPFASLMVTYTVGAVVSGIFYFVLNRGGNLLQEYVHLNWAPFLLGLSVVGIEVGFIYAYKAGWPVGTASIVQSAISAIALIVFGLLIYQEALTWNKILGIAICCVGLWLINK